MTAAERAIIEARRDAVRVELRSLDAFLDAQERATARRGRREPPPVEVSDTDRERIERAMTSRGARFPRTK